MNKLLVPALFLLASPAFARDLGPCYMPDASSCWFAENKSQFSVRIECKDKYNARFSTTVTPNMSSSQQFSPAWGDSLGYPEPGVVSQCQVAYSNGERTSFAVKALDWGNTVRMTFLDSAVEVRITSRSGRSSTQGHAVGF